MPDESDLDRNRLRTVKEAMTFLRVGRDTLYRLGKQGDIEMLKVGGGTRVTQDSLDAYVKNAKRFATAKR